MYKKIFIINMFTSIFVFSGKLGLISYYDNFDIKSKFFVKSSNFYFSNSNLDFIFFKNIFF